MVKKLLVLGLVISGAGLPLQGRAVTWLNDYRFTQLTQQFPPDHLYAIWETETEEFGNFSSALAMESLFEGALATGVVSQDSWIDGGSMGGSAAAEATLEIPAGFVGSADSISWTEFYAEFSIQVPHRYDLQATIFGTDPYIDSTYASILTSPTFDEIAWVGYDQDGSGDFRLQGELDPGTYFVFVEAWSKIQTFTSQPEDAQFYFGESRFDFTLDLKPVPLPGSALLLGSGLLMLARARFARG